MKRLLFLLFGASAAAYAAAPVINKVIVDFVDYSTARVTVRILANLGSPSFVIAWGYAHDSQPVNSIDYATTNNCVWKDTDFSGLGDTMECTGQLLVAAPGRRIYVQLKLKDGPDQTVWACGGGTTINQGTIQGLTCATGENYPYYTSLAVPGPPTVPYPNGTYPEAVKPPSYTFPTIVGTETVNQFTVATNCSDLTAQLNAAVTAAATKDVQVRLPVGIANACPTFTPPAYNGPFKIVIRSAAFDNQLPPPGGGRPEPRYYPYMAYVNTTTEAAALGINTSTNHYIFMGLYLTQRSAYPTTDITPLTITRSEQGTVGAATWKFTTSTPLPAQLTAGSIITLDGVPSLNSVCGPGPMKINAVFSATTFQLYCADTPISEPTSVVSPTPDTTTANRFVIPAAAQRIEDVTPGACAGGNARARLATGSRWGLPDNTVIHIVDTAGIAGLSNRGWRVATASGRDICLQNSAGLTGTYTAFSGVWAVEAKTTDLVTSGGGNDIWFDRVVVDGGAWPNRSLAALNMTATTNSGVVNSRIMNVGGWVAIDPVTSNWVTYRTQHGSMAGYAIEFTYAQNLLLENNYLEGSGIMLFSQNGDAALALPTTHNVMIRRNEFYVPPDRMAGSPASNGRYYPHRHWWECKACTTVEFSGNYGMYNYSEDVVAGPAIAMTTRQVNTSAAPYYVDGVTTPGAIRDILIKNNYFKNVAGVFVTSFDSDSNRSGTAPSVRFAFTGNVVDNMDYYTYRADPTTSGPGKNYNPTTGSLIHYSHNHGTIVDHNTVLQQTGQGPNLIEISGYTHPHSHTRFTNNIYQDQRTPNGGGAQIGDLQTYWAGSLRDTWYAFNSQYTYPSGVFSADPYSLFQGNLIVPGSENNQQYAVWDTSCLTSTTVNCNWTPTETDNYWGIGSNTANTFNYQTAAWTGTTPNTRVNEVGMFDIANGNYRSKSTGLTIAGKRRSTDGKDVGADQDAIDIERRIVKGFRATDIGTTTATLAWTAPVAGETCTLTCPACSTIRTTNALNTRPRSTALASLSAATMYTVYLTCGSAEESLSFRTQ